MIYAKDYISNVSKKIKGTVTVTTVFKNAKRMMGIGLFTNVVCQIKKYESIRSRIQQ